MRRTFLLGSAAALLAACAPNAPVPAAFGRSEAKVVASADHWQQMASLAAQQLRPAIEGEVVVQGDHRTQFGRAFQSLLATALTENGVRVVRRPAADRLVFTAQRVRHPLRNTRSLPAQQVEPGLWIRRADGHMIPPDGVSELILTVSVFRGSEVRASAADVYYVAGGDEWLYELPPAPRQIQPRAPLPVVYR